MRNSGGSGSRQSLPLAPELVRGSACTCTLSASEESSFHSGWPPGHPHCYLDMFLAHPFPAVYIIGQVLQVAQMVKNLPAMQETLVRSLGQEDPLEEKMATHSSILAWRIPWTEESGGYSPWGREESDMTEWLTLYYI